MRRLGLAFARPLCIVLTLPALGATTASTPDATAVHPADGLTSALVAMGEAHVGDQVLSAWLVQQGEIPRLTGEQLARLKTAGLSDGILLQLVRGSASPETASPATPAQQKETSEGNGIPAVASQQEGSQEQPPPAEGGARIRVLVQSTPGVDYCEVLLDGTEVASRGRLREGVVAAGSRAPRTETLALRTPTVLYEGNVDPGRHHVRTGFAFARLQDEFTDVRQGRRQRLVPEGVRALEDDRGTACTVGPGELCVVTARFRKVDRGLLSGRSSYTVSYDTVVLSQGDADVQAAWASPAP